MILWDTIHRALFAKPMPEAERAELRANMAAADLKIAAFKAQYPLLYAEDGSVQPDLIRELEQRI